MGVTHGAVHLPAHRLSGKRASEAGLAESFARLCVPGWDETPLTMAIEAGLRLPEEALEGVERVRLFLEGEPEQVGLTSRALGIEAPASLASDSLLAELATNADANELWLAAGSRIGGCGIAMRTRPGEGAGVLDTARVDASPLGVEEGAGLREACDRLETSAERLEVPGRASIGGTEPLGYHVGRSGPAAVGLELLARWAAANGEAVVAEAGGGQALAVHVENVLVPVEGLDTDGVDLSVDRYRSMQEADPTPWSEASQGAYVSREVYDADPERRYGARARGPGEVVATTTIRGGPPGEFARQHEASGPYDVIVVDVDGEEGREIGQAAVPPGQLAIGDRVRPVVRKVFSQEGQIRYGLKWWPEDGL